MRASLAVLALVFVPAVAHAQAPTTTAAEHLRAGEQALADLEYEQAAEELTLAAVAPDATPAERVRAHLLAGVAHRIAGREPQARLSFRAALTSDPAASLEWATTSPKVLELFAQVKREVALERGGSAGAQAQQQQKQPRGPAPEGPPPALVAVAAGAAVAVVSAGIAGFFELQLSSPDQLGSEREPTQLAGRVALAGVGAGVVVVAAGAAAYAMIPR